MIQLLFAVGLFIQFKCVISIAFFNCMDDNDDDNNPSFQ